MVRATSGIAAKVAASLVAAQPVTMTGRDGIGTIRAARGLAGLTNAFVGDGAAVDDRGIAQRRGERADRLTLGDVEAAAVIDDFDHAGMSAVPEKTKVAGPVMLMSRRRTKRSSGRRRAASL